MTQVAAIVAHTAPVLIATAGERAQTRLWEFFEANVRNRHAARLCPGDVGISGLMRERRRRIDHQRAAVLHVSTYIQQLGRERSAPTVKQRLAAIRHLFDWSVKGESGFVCLRALAQREDARA